MNSIQTNKLNMYLAVKSSLASHEEVWKSLPAFAAGTEELEEHIAELQTLAQTQTNRNGAAADKAQAFATVLDCGFEVAAATRAYAVASGDPELAARVDYSRSDLGRGRDMEVLTRCRSILATATAHVDSLPDYGVTPAKLTAFKKAIDAFQDAQAKPRHGRATSSAATKALPDLFGQVDELLEARLDGLIVQFRDTDPAFYNEYTAARLVLGRTNGHKTHDAPTPAPAPVPQPA